MNNSIDTPKPNTDMRLVVGLVILCFCMRAPMSVVGPLVSQIKETLQLSSAFAGLLTTIPLVLFALIAPLAGSILHRTRVRPLFATCILGILCGILLRSYGGLHGLLIGTVLLGLGIGIFNVAVPVWIRQTFPRSVGPVMGTYSASMTALSALAAGFCVAIALRLNGWQNAMAVLTVFPAIALPVWLALAKPESRLTGSAAPVRFGITAKSFSNRCVALAMGLQSALFFALIAWLPSILAERGFTASGAGLMVLLFQLVSLISNFAMPVLFQRFPKRRKALAVSGAAVYAAGFALLLLNCAAAGVLLAAVVLLGFASGLCLSFSLTVITVKGANDEEAIGLSAFAQCIGYLIAAPAPTLFGSLYDAAGSFTLPILLMLILCAPLLFFGVKSVAKLCE